MDEIISRLRETLSLNEQQINNNEEEIRGLRNRIDRFLSSNSILRQENRHLDRAIEILGTSDVV